MKLLRVFALCVVLLAATGCSNGTTKEAPAPKQPEITQEMINSMVQEAIKAHPELVLDAIADNDDRVLSIMEKAIANRQKNSMRQQWLAEMSNPREPLIDMNRSLRGPVDAPITIVEYSDFQCPYCSRAAMNVEEVLMKYQGQVRILYKHIPLKGHKHAEISARMFEAASLQDDNLAWQLYAAMFSQQDRLKEEGESWILAQAAELGLNVDEMKEDAHGPIVSARLESDKAEATAFGFKTTPTFLVNGILIKGAVSPDFFFDLIELLKEKGLTTKPAPAPKPTPAEEENPLGPKDSSCLDCLDKE